MILKILHIVGSSKGGVTSYLKNLITEMDKDLNFTILTFEDFNTSFQSLAQEKEVLIIKMPRPKYSGLSTFLKFLWTFFKNNKFDFIESHFSDFRSIPFKLISSVNFSRKFYVHSHQTSYIYGRKMTIKEKITSKFIPHINSIISTKPVACSLEAKEYAYGTKNNQESYIIYNSIPDNYFNKQVKKIHFSENKINVGHIGIHTSAKNIFFILEIAKYTKKNNNDILFYLIGEGPLTSEIKEYIEENNLTDTVKLVGFQEDIKSFLTSLDVILLPSFSEGFPTILLESQAARVPALVSDSVTKSIDLNLGLIEFLPIDLKTKNLKRWVSEISLIKNRQIPSQDKVQLVMTEKGLTSSEMWKIFKEMVYREVGENNREKIS